MTQVSAYARFLFIMALVTPLTLATAKDPEADSRHGFEQEAFYLINQYRKENKFPPLLWDDGIAKVARFHSRNMAIGKINFGHDGFGDRVSQLKVVMIGLRGAGENVFETNDPDQVAQSAVITWLKSPPHLHNIRGNYNYSGLGAWEDEKGMIYFTQIFVKIQPRAQEAQIIPSSMEPPLGLLAQPYPRTQP